VKRKNSAEVELARARIDVMQVTNILGKLIFLYNEVAIGYISFKKLYTLA
jgi:hypothetical protein